MGAADTFFKAAVELLLYAEQGSLELQVHKSLPTDTHNHTHYPPEKLIQGQGQGQGVGQGVGVKECGATCDNDSDDYEGEKASIGHLAVWPPLVDPYLSALVSSFHSKHGSNVCSLRVCNAVIRVLQLITSLHLQFPLHLNTPLPVTSGNKRHYASGNNEGFSKLFSASEIKVLSSPVAFDEARPDAVTHNSICGAREAFLRACFRKIAILGEQQTSNGTALSRASLCFGDATSASMTASNDVSTCASSVCYMLSDLWSIKVQWMRSCHLEALLNADCEEGEHRDMDRGQGLGLGQGGDLARCAAECSGARDIEVENLLPLVRFLFPSFSYVSFLPYYLLLSSPLLFSPFLLSSNVFSYLLLPYPILSRLPYPCPSMTTPAVHDSHWSALCLLDSTSTKLFNPTHLFFYLSKISPHGHFSTLLYLVNGYNL